MNESDAFVGARYKLNDIFCAAWLSHCITALAKCGVADAVGETPATIQEIAEQTGTHPQSLYRAMRAAAANGIFIEVKPGVFAHNPVSEILRSDHAYSWRGMACMWNHPSCLRGWEKFSDVLRDGESGIRHAFGKPLYEHLNEVPEATLAFSDAMISNSAHVAGAIANEFPFEQFHNVMDLGGGIGTLLMAILKKHPHMTGNILEIEELKKEAEGYFAECEESHRARLVVGNFLESVPAGNDLYLIKNSLWNWDDERSSKIMTNVREALGTNDDGRFLIIEYVIDEDNAPWTTLYDLQILNMPGGRARTRTEYTELLHKNGFALESAILVEDQNLLLARPI